MRKSIIMVMAAITMTVPLLGIAVGKAHATIHSNDGDCGSCDNTARTCGVVITPSGGWTCYGNGHPLR